MLQTSKVLAFGACLALGILADEFVDVHTSQKPQCCFGSLEGLAITPVEVASVPDQDFPLAGIRSAHFEGGTIRLRALVGVDGRLEEVRTTPMLPYGVAESEAGHGEFADYTAFIVNGRFVSELEFGLTDLAIEQLRNSRFTPMLIDGEALSTWITVETDFRYTESRWSTGCSAIEVTIMNDQGVVGAVTRGSIAMAVAS